MNKIIGLAAQLANGKDVVANYLVQQLNLDVLYYEDKWRRLGFADAVKHVFMNSFGVDWDFIETWKRKDEIPDGFDLNVRKSLQFIGDGFRKIQSDIWIKTALKNANGIILSDVRYLNEIKAISDRGGINILIWRKGYENNDPNPSESQIKPYVDFCLRNYKEGPLAGQIEPRDLDSGYGYDCLEYIDFFLKNDTDLEGLYAKIDTLVIPYLKMRGL